MLVLRRWRKSPVVKLTSRRPALKLDAALKVREFVIRKPMRILVQSLLLGAVLVTTSSCQNTELQQEARQAEKDGRVINNDMMTATYPSTFRPGTPAYLERDFEAGADFICDEIKLKHKRDLCAEDRIGWRK